MVNELHWNLLKYFAIFGLVPYMETMQQQHIKKHHTQRLPRQRHYRPHNHHHQHGGGGRNQAILHWQKIYTVALIVANLITTLYGVIYVPFEDTTIISDLISIIVFVIQLIVIFAVLLETMLSYDKHYKLMANHLRVQLLMQQLLQTQLCAQTIRQRQRRKYSFYAVIIYGCLIAVMVVVTLKYYYGYFWRALVAVLILRTRCWQMLIMLDYMYFYLEMLNRKLNALVACRVSQDHRCLDIDYRYLESYDYLDITIHLYWSFLTLMNLYEKYYMYVTIATLAPLSTVVFMLCYTAEQCEQQCNMLLISLKRLLNTSNKSSTNSLDYNFLLQDFIMQILHNPIRISANAYFTLNLKFLMAICANIVTYLVILLQFRKTSSRVFENDNVAMNTTTTQSMYIK